LLRSDKRLRVSDLAAASVKPGGSQRTLSLKKAQTEQPVFGRRAGMNLQAKPAVTTGLQNTAPASDRVRLGYNRASIFSGMTRT
jgi:hypothetical protein